MSKQTTLRIGSNAAQTPNVQQFCSFDVWNTSSPLKNTWFRVWLLPSPVFPNIDTTLILVSFSVQFNFLRNSSASETCRFSRPSSNRKLLLLLLWHFVQEFTRGLFFAVNRLGMNSGSLSKSLSRLLSRLFMIAGSVDSAFRVSPHGFHNVLMTLVKPRPFLEKTKSKSVSATSETVAEWHPRRRRTGRKTQRRQMTCIHDRQAIARNCVNTTYRTRGNGTYLVLPNSTAARRTFNWNGNLYLRETRGIEPWLRGIDARQSHRH